MPYENINGLIELSSESRYKIAVVGVPKAGKSWFAYTAPERAEDEVPSVIYKDHEIKIVPVATPGSRRVFAAYKNGKRVTNCFATVKEVKTALSSQATDATIPRRGARG
jgi:hypothetical protein